MVIRMHQEVYSEGSRERPFFFLETPVPAITDVAPCTRRRFGTLCGYCLHKALYGSTRVENAKLKSSSRFPSAWLLDPLSSRYRHVAMAMITRGRRNSP